MKLKFCNWVAVFLCLSVFVSSCSSFEELKVNQIKGLQFKGVSGNVIELQVTAQIENPNFFSVHVEDADLTLYMKGNVIGKVQQMDKLDIEGHSNKDYSMNLKIQLQNIQSVLGTAMQFFTGGDPGLSIKGALKVHSFLYKRTIQVSELKLSK